MNFQKQYDYTHTNNPRERFNKPSLTIPDQSMTVSELVERNKRGLPLGGSRVPMYSQDPENDFVPDFKKLDLAEVQEMHLQAQQTIQENQEKLNQAEQAKKQYEVNKLKKQLEQLQMQLDHRNDPSGALAGNPKPNPSNITE